METLVPLMMPVGLASVLAVLVISLTRITIVWMALRGVPPKRRAKVLRAVGLLVSADGSRRRHRARSDDE